MRIAFASEFPLHADRVLGGLESVVRSLALPLVAERGHEVHVVSFHEGLDGAREDLVEGIHVHRFPLPRRFGNITFGAGERRQTAEVLRRIAPDVVHSLGLGPKAIGTAASGLPWVVTVNGVQSNEARIVGGVKNLVRSWVCRRMEDWSLRLARHVILPNPAVRGVLGTRIGSIETHVVENAVDDAFFEIERQPEPNRIVCVGRLIPIKAPENLIVAVKLLRQSGIEVSVRFVGPSDHESYVAGLRKQVEDLGLSHQIDFLGFVSDETLREELGRASVLVHPSRVEVAPLSVMQAMASGCPVVATDVGGTRHLVEEGASGLLVPSGNPARLAARIRTVLEEPERAAQMGDHGRRLAEERFRRSRVLDETLAVYGRVLSGFVDSRD